MIALRHHVTATLSAIMVASAATCYAGNLAVEVFSKTQVAAVASVKSDDSVLTKDPSTNRWAFDLKNPPIISVPIQINVEQIPTGYQSVPMRYLLPYYADRSRPYPLGTALANDKTNDPEGVRPFLTEMGVPRSTFGNSFILYQRARLLWAARSIQLQTRKENADDVAIAYWLLYAAGDLAKNYLYQPDDITWQAADWISGVSDDDVYSRVPKATIDALLKQLLAIDTSFYDSMIGRLEQERATKRDLTCSRFSRLDVEFSELTPAERFRIDPNDRLAVRIKDNTTWCAAQAAMQSGDATLTDSQKIELRATARTARETLESISAISQSNQSAQRVKENVQIIESYVGVAQ